MNVTLLRAIIRAEGLTDVHSTSDPRLVAGLLTEHRPDLVLLDLHMPHLDGFQVLEQVQQYAAGSYLPVLVLTADTGHDARDRALRQGAQDYLVKPLDTVETTLRIANLLRTRSLYAQLRETADPGPMTEPGAHGPMTDEIATVLRTQGIVPHFQPVVDLVSLRPVGFEGLSRFPGPAARPPDVWFIEADRVGLGYELECLAVTLMRPVLESLPDECFLALNLSPAAILRLPDRQLWPPEISSRIVIEITEHAPVEDYLALHRALAFSRSHGVRLAADDLGAGYAGFRHLLNLQPDIIKLDISLVRGLRRQTPQHAMASALVTFARDVGSIVIAEGVEQQEELEALQALGAHWGQGYLLGRPQPPPLNL